MRWLLAWSLFFLAAAVGAAVPQGSIDEFLDTEMEASNAPGLSYAIAEDSAITTGHRGVTRTGTSDLVNDETVFLIGSVSKSFTALATMRLVEAGRLGLDDPLSRHLEMFEAGTPRGNTTIRQLLSHTSGYSMLQGNQWHDDFSMDDGVFERRAEEIAQLELAREPGTSWDYSNINYMLLGRLIEVASGQSYSEYVNENVLAAAGMNDSFVHDSDSVERLATGHTPWFGSRRQLYDNRTGLGIVAGGGIASTAPDMGRYMAMMMNGEDDVISAESKALMMRPANDASPNYGLGWFLDTERGLVFHSGANIGYEALVTMVPAERKGAAVMVNAGSGFGYGDVNHIRQGVTARALGLDYQGTGAGWGIKSAFLSIVLSPFLFVLGAVQAWRKRAELRAKSGWPKHFSLWFPLLMTFVLAYVMLVVIPSLFGAPLAAIRLFVPDLGLGLIATSITGLGWALFRMVLAYTGKAKEH